MRHSKPVRLKTAPTGGESVYLFLEFTIVDMGIFHRLATDFSNATPKLYRLTHVNKNVTCELSIGGGISVAY